MIYINISMTNKENCIVTVKKIFLRFLKEKGAYSIYTHHLKCWREAEADKYFKLRLEYSTRVSVEKAFLLRSAFPWGKGGEYRKWLSLEEKWNAICNNSLDPWLILHRRTCWNQLIEQYHIIY